jgi:hypothetical protein
VTGLAAAREALAAAVTGAGLQCSAYAPDTVMAPAAFVDRMSMDYSAAAFCGAMADATIVTLAQRNDTAGSTAWLEGFIGPVVDALTATGARVVSAQSGTTQVGGSDVPAVIYTVQFPTA